MSEKRREIINSATPEMMGPREGLQVFFNWAEKTHPQGVKELVGVIGSLMPEGGEAATEQGIRDGLAPSNLDLGFDAISSWLTDVGAEGFRDINWLTRKGFLTGAKIKGIQLPAKEKVAGGEVQAVLKSFSATVKKAEAKGMGPVQIVGNLLQESAGSKLTNNGSATLRTELVRALGGEPNLKWLRGPLEIKDVVETKPAAALKPLPEISRAETEFIRKKNRIKEYLTKGDGMDFLSKSWDENKWEHVGEDGSVKQVFRPLTGALRNEKVCLRRNVSDEHTSPAVKLRAETRFLERVNNPHFVKVYAHAPLEAADRGGIGEYSRSQHWEIVDYVDGITVERGWSEVLTPAVKLKTILAACVCEYDATHSDPPVRLSDVRTDAFRVQPDGSIKMIDVQVHEDYISGDDSESIVIARDLAMLCLEIFPGKYRESLSGQAIDAVFNPTLQAELRRTALPGEQFPSLEEILRGSQMPDDLKRELKAFFDSLKLWSLKSESVSESLLNRILPIAQRLEREEGAVRAEKLAAEKRQEIQRRAAERGAKPAESKTENWEGAVKKLIEDPFAQIAYGQTQSVMAAAAAYSLNAEISNGLVGEEQFIGLVKRIAALSQNMRLKKAQPRLLLQWPAHQRLFLEDEISRTAYEATGSIVAAAAAFSLREEIIGGTIAEEKFVPFVREVATLVQKTRRQIKH